jgi:hypothetical protein
VSARFTVLLFLCALGADALAVGTKDLLGMWEAARSPEGERVYLRLMEKGKAEVVAEYDFQLPGQPVRRGRSTTFAKWTVKGSELTLSYAKVRDRLRYNQKAPLSQIGLTGRAPALAQVGKADTNSRLRGVVLWKAPHDYQLKADTQAKAPAPPAEPKK